MYKLCGAKCGRVQFLILEQVVLTVSTLRYRSKCCSHELRA
jgi:hypothetical protein